MMMIENMFSGFHMMDRTTAPDPYGGHKDTYIEGAAFKAYARKDNSTEATIAEKNGLEEFFTIVHYRRFHLRQNDVIKRDSDGQLFRITSNTLDSEAPDQSSVKIARCTAERWKQA